VEPWVIEILKGYGLAGVVIAGLVAALVFQTKAVGRRDLELRKLHEQRAIEREKLVELLAAANNTQRITAEVTASRNEIMDDLARAMMTQAHSNDRLGDKVAGQTEMFKERLGDFKHVVDSFGESNRVLTGLVAEIRNILIGHGTKLDAMPAAVVQAQRLAP
jgi:hypothetical protein